MRLFQMTKNSHEKCARRYLVSLRASSLAGLRGSRGVGVGKERELVNVSHEFEYLRPKSGREMLIGRFDQVMTYYILSRTISLCLKTQTTISPPTGNPASPPRESLHAG